MSLSLLPPEVLERIISLTDIVDCCDVVQLSCTSRHLNTIAKSGVVWRQHFRAKYSRLYHSPGFNRSLSESRDWRSEFISRYQTGKFLLKKLDQMSPKHFLQSELCISDFQDFDNFLLGVNPSNSMVPAYLMDHLFSILHDTDTGDTFTNLTVKYYGRNVARHIQHRLLKPRVMQLVEKSGASTHNSTFSDFVCEYEEVLILIAQWCQPHLNIAGDMIRLELDRLADGVFKLLVRRGILSSKAQASVRDVKTMQKDSPLSKKILDCANEYLESEGFSGNSEDYYEPENSYVNQVLERKLGIPISLSLLFTCILSRLGVYCQPVNFPSHFLLRWLEFPEKEDEMKRFTYIDVFNKGKRLTSDEAMALIAPHITVSRDHFSLARPTSAAQRMLRNLISIGASQSSSMRDSSYSLLRSTLELMLLFNREEEADYTFMLCRVYLQLNINHEEVGKMLENYSDIPGLTDQVEYMKTACQIQFEEKQKNSPIQEVKKRLTENKDEELKYWVGMVAKHRKYNYKCVVYGWDKRCTASKSWIHQMGVNKLRRKDNQPFYSVLVEDGSSRYAADENIIPCEPETIAHCEVGKYFKEYRPEYGYVPNKELSTMYPDDEDFAMNFYKA